MKAINIKWDTDGEDIKLPTEIEIPDGMTDEDEISDFISNKTGFCHMGFTLEEDTMNKNIKNIIGVGQFFLNDNGETYLILHVNKEKDRTLLMGPTGLFIGAWGIDPKGYWCQGHYFMSDFEAAVNWVLGKD